MSNVDNVEGLVEVKDSVDRSQGKGEFVTSKKDCKKEWTEG